MLLPPFCKISRQAFRFVSHQFYIFERPAEEVAKTAQYLALVQLINTISGFPEQDKQTKTNQTIHTALHARSIQKSTQVFLNQKTQKYKKS